MMSYNSGTAWCIQGTAVYAFRGCSALVEENNIDPSVSLSDCVPSPCTLQCTGSTPIRGQNTRLLVLRHTRTPGRPTHDFRVHEIRGKMHLHRVFKAACR